ncbi:hypothetical protein [Humibacillus xanthopallidus]|nr:hypothetical protein [Humibacillus xanthopallidus]
MTGVQTIETRARAALVVVTSARVRFALLAVLGGLVFCAVGLGSRSATLSDLTSAIQTGRVTEVTVDGGLPPGATGYSAVTLQWEEGAPDHTATVLQLSDAGQDASDASSGERTVGDVRSHLVAADPSGSLSVVTGDLPAMTGPVVAGWSLPDWMGPATMLLWGATVLLMIFGPEPWWATRWGWFWLLVSPAAIVAVPIYLLVSGPPPGVERGPGMGWRAPGRSTFMFLLFFVLTFGV